LHIMFNRHILLLLFFFWGFSDNIASTPAFPGANGGGAITRGGRGGRVIEVTNLNDRGPGSFRSACEAAGPRTIVFKVSGIIDIKEAIVIKHPYVTIAGQTAPGGGVILKGHNLVIVSHDVIMRFMRIRVGRRDDFAFQEGDCLVLTGDVYNVVVDHCSFSWSNDENVSIWRSGAEISNITFSWNLIAEGLTYKHPSCAFMVGGEKDNHGIRDILIHHNIFMSCKNRMPLVGCHDVQIINNIMYNWGWWPTGISCGVQADIIANKYVPGPNTGKRSTEVMVRTDWENNNYGPTGDPSIYIAGNIGPGNPVPGEDNWSMLMENKLWHSLGRPPSSTKCRRDRALIPSFPVTVCSATNLDEILLNDVGACRRLDAEGQWQINRDNVDIRLLKEYKERTGIIPVDENAVGGFPKISPSPAYLDSDHDGMPDTWELMYHFGSRNATDGSGDPDGDGYTNLEEFLNATNPRKTENL